MNGERGTALDGIWHKPAEEYAMLHTSRGHDVIWVLGQIALKTGVAVHWYDRFSIPIHYVNDIVKAGT